MPIPTPTHLDSRVTRLEVIERKLTDLLTDIRVLRVDLGNEARDKGVLGSRGFTQFILERLQSGGRGFTLIDLLTIAEKAGYSVPSTRVLSKRLTEYRIRTGNIFHNSGYWFWGQKP